MCLKLTTLFSKSNPQYESHINNLLNLAYIDGHYHEREKEYLEQLAKRYKIKQSNLTKIESGKKYISFQVPDTKKERFRFLAELTEMMLIDGQIHPKETELCYLFACDYGFAPEKAQDLLNVIASKIENGVSVEELVDNNDACNLI